VKKQKPITAKDLVQQLQADPESRRRSGEREDRRALQDAQFRVVTEGLRERLAALGYPIDSLGKLAAEYAPLPETVTGVLLEALPLVRNISVEDVVVRALAAASAPFDGTPLIRLFEQTASESLRGSIANTLALGRPLGVSDWILRALRTPAYGKAREMLALAAARLAPAAEANRVLVELLDQLPGHAALGLEESGGIAELQALQARSASTTGWVRKALDRATKLIERRLQASDASC